MGDIPASDIPWDEIARYALPHDDYDRWHCDLGIVDAIVAPLQMELTSTGKSLEP